MRKKKPPILQYVCLALLFALATAYQIRSAMYAFPNYFHLQAAAYPFVPDYQKGRPVLEFVTKSASQAGVQNNDILLAVNGRPLTGLAVFGEAIRTAKPGDTLAVQVLRPGETAPRSASIQLPHSTGLATLLTSTRNCSSTAHHVAVAVAGVSSWRSDGYQRWKRQREVVLRQEHRPGEKLFVDLGPRHGPHLRSAEPRSPRGFIVRRRAGSQQLCLRRSELGPADGVAAGLTYSSARACVKPTRNRHAA